MTRHHCLSELGFIKGVMEALELFHSDSPELTTTIKQARRSLDQITQYVFNTYPQGKKMAETVADLTELMNGAMDI